MATYMNLEKLKPRISPLPEGMNFKNPHALIATWFGSGLLRPASGTIGTIAALPLGYLISWATHPIFLLALH